MTHTHTHMQAAHATGKAGPDLYVRWSAAAMMLAQPKVALRAVHKGCEIWPSSAEVGAMQCIQRV